MKYRNMRLESQEPPKIILRTVSFSPDIRKRNVILQYCCYTNYHDCEPESVSTYSANVEQQTVNCGATIHI